MRFRLLKWGQFKAASFRGSAEEAREAAVLLGAATRLSRELRKSDEKGRGKR